MTIRNVERGASGDPSVAPNDLIDGLRRERDAYQQELFETERHSAWLARERQRLLDELGAVSKQDAAAVWRDHRGQPMIWRPDEQLRYQDYIRQLEGWITSSEQQIADLLTEIAVLQSSSRPT